LCVSLASLRERASIISDESNFLLNPAHPDFAKLSIGTPKAFW
jgi:hypothetical protein